MTTTTQTLPILARASLADRLVLRLADAVQWATVARIARRAERADIAAARAVRAAAARHDRDAASASAWRGIRL